MNRPGQDRPEASAAADERFWQAFAQAAGFEDELRELVASEEIDAVDADPEVAGSGNELTAGDLLAADRLHELLLAARPVAVEPATVELAPQRSANVDSEPRRQVAWLAALSLVTLASVAVVATVVFFRDDGTQAGTADAEVASAERLAEEWVAVREEAGPRDVVLLNNIDADGEPTVDLLGFEETPDWLVLAIAHQAELAGEAMEEATP